MTDYVYVITALSESGDTYGPFVFWDEPTDEQKKDLIRKECDWYGEDGPGNYGSYTYLTITRTKIR